MYFYAAKGKEHGVEVSSAFHSTIDSVGDVIICGFAWHFGNEIGTIFEGDMLRNEDDLIVAKLKNKMSCKEFP